MATIKYCLLLLLLYAIPVSATVFYTNCTLPPSTWDMTFVSTPNVRGTYQIVRRCLFILIICTWTVQHFNIPPEDISVYAEFMRRPYWTFMTLLMPDMLVGFALGEFLSAIASMREMKRQFPGLVEQGAWTATHAFYANMGGFVLRERLVAKPKPHDTSPIAGGPLRRLHSTAIIKCLQAGLLRTSPHDFDTERNIQHRARGECFFKGIAAIEIVWLVVEAIVRNGRNLPILPLEISVIAFSICVIISYGLWRKKPQNARVLTYLDAARPLSFLERKILSAKSSPPVAYRPASAYLSLKKSPQINLPFGFKISFITVGQILGGTIFGAFHLLAWNFNFATQYEKMVWRISAIAMTALPGPTYLLAFMIVPVTKRDKASFKFYKIIAWLLLVVNMSFRVVVGMHVLFSLGFLPAEAYITTWATD